jgi:flagellar basal-body rod protein FlgC
MSLFKVFDIAGSGMSAQSLRLNITASNIANADSAASSVNQTYRAREPVFAAALRSQGGDGFNSSFNGSGQSDGVRVLGVVQSQAPLRKEYQPNNPLADKQGYIHLPNVNLVEEMANMIAASRSYQSNVAVVNASKQMLLRTLALGQ